MGEPAGNRVRAMCSLMMATCCDVAVSCGPKVRPARMGICMVAKYAVADDVVLHVHVAIHGHAGNADAAVPAALVKGEGREAGRLHSRKRAYAVLDLFEETCEAGIVALVAGDVGVDVQAQHIFLVEAGVDTVQVDERAQKETGSRP